MKRALIVYVVSVVLAAGVGYAVAEYRPSGVNDLRGRVDALERGVGRLGSGVAQLESRVGWDMSRSGLSGQIRDLQRADR
jgi:hypothetical protein